MVTILEKSVNLSFPTRDGVHILIAQVPNHLAVRGRFFRIADEAAQRDLFLSVLRTAASQREEDRIHFLLFPESSLPFSAFDSVGEAIQADLPENTVVVYGLEHIALSDYRSLLERFAADNAEAIEAAREEDEQEAASKPVNTCVTVIKERDGGLRHFFTAKTHPFAGEEAVERVFDLYRGKVFALFRCTGSPFNFMPVICFDYVYRDLNSSNIMEIIRRANDLFFKHHQRLDMLAVIQCNPKPEHRVFRDVAAGFYGEYLFKTPGTRDTITVFVNTSEDTVLEGTSEEETFGCSGVVVGPGHRLPKIKLAEFRTDDFLGGPVSRLRFGKATRLYLCRLFPHHETDPRSSRAMVKVTAVYRPDGRGGWLRLGGDELLAGVSH